jgi:hypothetical protein
MQTPRPADVVFWALALVAVGMFGLFVLVVAGALPADPAPEARPTATRAAAPAGEPEPPAATAAREVERPRSAAPPPPRTASAARLTTVVVTAARGDCWLSAWAGSADGRLLQELLLREGDSVRLRAKKVWLALGAAANVDVLVDGEPRQVAAGTIEVVLERRADA